MKTFANRTDEELALLYAAGDNKAFDELLARNQQKVFDYIQFVVHDYDLSNDIFQDTFIKAIIYLQDGKYTDTGKFYFWLTRIAHNAIIDKFRRIKSAHIVEPNDDNDLSNLTSDELKEGNREMEFVNNQIRADIRHMISMLPANQREVVYMRYYLDLSFKEIAEITGVSINTSLGRMRYAILNMRRMAKKNHMQLDMEF
ncbi:MAG: sigma-70 family RNA polymerase sigma factor [Prevotella sp.]|jgi:RNA polymerase sigma-70 factor (ECF subfamily)|nr:sigma-70 family RNA polymerase sigma factor [Prevotella sp.]